MDVSRTQWLSPNGAEGRHLGSFLRQLQHFLSIYKSYLIPSTRKSRSLNRTVIAPIIKTTQPTSRANAETNTTTPIECAKAALAHSLAHVELSKAPKAVHILLLEFPVINLLPEGGRLSLPQPSLVAVREKPPFDQNSYAVPDASIFAVVQVTPPDPYCFASASNTAQGLIKAVETVACEPGVTTMELVRYTGTKRNAEVTRFRLINKGKTSVVFDLDESALVDLLKKQATQKWICVLSDLIHRRSARSYYHVHNRLHAAYGENGVDVEESDWSTQWDTHPPRPARKLLDARLSRAQAGNSSAVQLPCGHIVVVREVMLQALQADSCAMYSCHKCEAPALQPEDFKELALRTERRRAAAFVAVNRQWRSLEGRIVDDTHSMLVPTTALLCALAAALGSLRPTLFIASPEMSFTNFAETAAVFAGFERKLQNANVTYETTPLALYAMLRDFADEARGRQPGANETTLIPSWTEDLERWLRRAVRLLADRACFRRHPKHVGVHKHEGRLCCGMQEPNAVMSDREVEMDENGEEITSMADLADMFDGSTVVDDPTGLDDLEALARQEDVAFGEANDGENQQSPERECFQEQELPEGKSAEEELLAWDSGDDDTVT
ncbi:hypothetical protein LTR56_004487 [Elasticomyces elasticus]|nr:hypothetical protein LTR56_004487 [Elasticomyces elasticus]KAK3654221.1 hypothetical protein LTR22_010847 [Elasticomyces elasticus]KAK4920006.1 hypothetical protein LTR49_012444 [Elasticomyces elasticus]KAK5758840.1 hypothetical protein LTS12_011081 [Elasticomyces elasticus]